MWGDTGYGWMDWMDGWVGGWVGWMDGWMDECGVDMRGAVIFARV